MSEIDLHAAIAAPEALIAEAKAGRMVILADDEDRENEGDLVIPAACCTAESVNFMARFARGLVCLAMARPLVERLHLPLMNQHNSTRFQTAFTVSIEAREGITTGISAADRAHTIQVAIAAGAKPEDIVTPGHIFPLIAKDGGVLVRTGHTEAAVDIARLAGFAPAGVICEIMKEDGSMARLPDLIAFAQYHNLKVGTISDLIAYRRRTETLVERCLTTPFHSVFGGDFTLHLYRNRLTGVEQVALVKGNITGDAPVLVRMHALDVLDDVLGDARHGQGGKIQAAMQQIGEAACGVIVLLRDAPSPLTPRLTAPSEAGGGSNLRDYGIGAQILLDLGVKTMQLLSNAPKHVVGLEGYGLHIAGYQPIRG